MLTEMDGLEDMVLGAMTPDGGFLTGDNLRNLLETVQAAFQEAHKCLYAETAEQAMT